MGKSLITTYKECLNEFVLKVSEQFAQELVAIVLQGGCVRDSEPIEHWSDIDLILIFKQYNPFITQFLGKLSNELDTKYKLRIDINLVYKYDIKDTLYKSKYCSSEIMNALNKRSVKILYGSIDSITLDGFNERAAVYVYLNVTLLIFRRYYVENIYYSFDRNKCKIYLQRILRIVFSIIRSSLRLLDIYVNPYHESLMEIKKLNILSQEHLQLLENLISIRFNFGKLDTSDDVYFLKLFADIERFVEYYINFAIGNYGIKIKSRNTTHFQD